MSLASAFDATSSLVAGVGVAALPFWSLPHLHTTAATLAELSGGRFVLGVGVSHREAAQRLGASFPASPLGAVRSALDELRATPVAFGGSMPVLVGALGPKMAALGASEADGVVLNWLTPAHAATSVAELRAAAGPGRTPLVVLFVRLARPEALRADAVAYDTMANYHHHFARQGLHTPEAVVSETCLAWDDPAAAKDRLAQLAEAGVDVVCLYPHGLTAEEREKAIAAVVR